MLAFDLAEEPLARLRADGAGIAGSVHDVTKQSDLLFLCLPSAKHVRAVFEGDGVLKDIRSGQIVVDLGTSSVSQTRDFAGQLRPKAHLDRRADRAHAAGGAGWHAQRDGRRRPRCR